MASDDEAAIRRIAREVYNVFANEGALTTPAELRAVEVAEQGLVCASCSSPVAITDEVCGRCGSRQAISGDDARYVCADCGQPIAHPEKTKTCPGCRGTKVTRADPSFKYECIKCGTGVSLEQPSCPSCGETRAVERIGGRPAETVVT